MPQGPRTYLRRFHYDTALSAGPEPLAALQALVGPDRILFGSDWPYVPDEVVGATADRALALIPEEAQAAVTGGNARRLFPKLAARLDGA
jgi:predicted TIM-barrel fold metal-dependent hydrolase